MDKGATTIEQYSTEWYKARTAMFTGSEIWKLMTEPKTKSKGISDTAITYILEKVHEKITGIPKMGFDNAATNWGVEHEPQAIMWYEKLTGNKVVKAKFFVHEEIDGFGCSPDGLVNDDGVLEVKCPFNGVNHIQHCLIVSDEQFKQEYKEYYWQTQCEMHLTGRKWCDFISFDPRIDHTLGLFTYRLKYNTEDALLMENKVINARHIYNEFVAKFK